MLAASLSIAMATVDQAQSFRRYARLPLRRRWSLRRLFARPVVGREVANVESAKIRSAPGKPVGDVRQDRPAIDRRRTRLEPEIDRFSFVDLLHGRGVLGVESGNVHEYVVVDEDAVLVL